MALWRKWVCGLLDQPSCSRYKLNCEFGPGKEGADEDFMGFPGGSRLEEVYQKILRKWAKLSQVKGLCLPANGKVFYNQGEAIYHKGTGAVH